ncbi:MAG: CRISPR-associated helicase Cas3' [Candidatus Omnitrophota bacterium]
MEYYAHSLEEKSVSKWQNIEDHLTNVAVLSKQFAESFGAGDWAYLAGLWHDVGKYSQAFQAYLRRANEINDEISNFFKGRVDHSTFGARYVYNCSNQSGKLMAYILAGHHSGLMDWQQDAFHGLRYRIEDKLIESIDYVVEKKVLPEKLPFKYNNKRFGFQLQFFIRMLFSCLVDADFLDTEKFMNPEQYKIRIGSFDLCDLYDIFWKKFDELRNSAKDSHVNKIREDILVQCLSASELSPGTFSLTVPTGGGKTLSSLAFALKHALKYNKRRIIYVVPFTSIIEQTAKIFRDMMGDEAVLEHHCNFIADEKDWKTKLAVENWDAPVIVTTNVQFFNSFLSRKTSKCRKLHNVVNSVVIFDEVQAIPVEKLQPCIEIIKELALNYGVSSVLCSATQPAISQSDDFKKGIENVREIISDVNKLFQILKRTDVIYIGRQENDKIVERINQQNQVLCVVSTRKLAKDIFEQIGDSAEKFHLSALMYPVHRSRILAEIKQRLKDRKNCRVVSTQVIEAGVDIDFPVVIRALSGMDSIAQAAGRCNREGLRDKGKVFIFEPADGIPAGYFRQTAQCAERLLDTFKGRLLEPECIEEYFLNYYWLTQSRMDKDDILTICQGAVRGDIQFEELAKFRMIQNATEPIVIPVEREVVNLLEELRYVKCPAKILRQLQQYTVQVYPSQLKELMPYLEVNDYIKILRVKSLYDEKTGLVKDVPEYLNVEDTIC